MADISIPEEFYRFYYFLLSGSDNFKERLYEIKTKYFDATGALKDQDGDKHLLAIKKLFDDFFIPCDMRYVGFVLEDLLNRDRTFNDILIITRFMRPDRSLLDSPGFHSAMLEDCGIIVHIKRPITRDKWLELWKHSIKPSMKLKDLFFVKQKADFLPRKYLDIDLMIEMYRLKKGENLTADEIAKRFDKKSSIKLNAAIVREKLGTFKKFIEELQKAS